MSKPGVLTDEQVHEIAVGIYRNELYPSWRVPLELMRSVFMVLAFATKEHIEQWRADEATTFIGDLAKAGPRSINGHPVFMECRVLNATDTDRVRAQLKLLMAAVFMQRSLK